jgi:hypothetical protein
VFLWLHENFPLKETRYANFICLLFSLCWRKLHLWIKCLCRGPGCARASDRILPVQIDSLATELGHSKSLTQGSPRCCLGSTKSVGSSSDASSRIVLYHFQYVILQFDSALLFWFFTFSLRDNTSLSDTLVHIAEHSPIWHYAIRKLPSIFFNCCSFVTITEGIHVCNISIFVIWKCSNWTQSLFFVILRQNRTACNNWHSNLTTYDAHSGGQLSVNMFLWLHVTLK